MIGVAPVQVPLSAKRTEPTVAEPEIDGRTVLTGAAPVRTLDGSETAVAVPKVFVAVTAIRNREPKSSDVGMYELSVAAATSLQFEPELSPRRHWYVEVIVGAPVHVPGRRRAGRCSPASCSR